MGGGDMGKSPGILNAGSESEDSQNVDVKLTFGVFFDGTQNSMGNIDERKAFSDYLQFREFMMGDKKLSSNAKTRSEIVLKEGSSYLNEYSNVARFYKCFKEEEDEIIPIYVEGIGTKPRNLQKFKKKSAKELGSTDKIIEQEEKFVEHFEYFNSKYFDKGEKELKELDNEWDEGDIDEFVNIACSDDTAGSAFGIGAFGVKAKVDSMCTKIKVAIDDYFHEKGMDSSAKANCNLKLDLYVFGFSRGAAAARCFSGCLKKDDTVPLVLDFHIYPKRILDEVINIFTMMFAGEGKYKICLKDRIKNSYKFNDSDIKVKFLGLYDTVSSYGFDFEDDIKELSLKIKKDNVEDIYQICAGDEYRQNFALTDISSVGDDKHIIIPGAHSDIGGGYSHNQIDKVHAACNSTSGHKGIKALYEEGWFKEGTTVRVISNLYSVIPFNLMKEKVPSLILDCRKLKEYELPTAPNMTKQIDGIDHGYSKVLIDFNKKVKSFGSYYKFSGLPRETIDFLLLDKRDDLESEKNSLKRDEFFLEETPLLSGTSWFDEKRKINKQKQKMVDDKITNVNSDEKLLKDLRNGFLHLSAKTEGVLDLAINRGHSKWDFLLGKNSRRVLKG